MSSPQVVSRQEWLAARKALLVKEKEITRAQDAVAALRRELPMVRVDREYVFEGTEGKATLLDLFEGRRQLIIYHFMFGPDREHGCPSCSMTVDGIGHLAHLHARDTTLAVVSRAPVDRIEPFRQRMGWTFPWYSSFGSDFNYDFHVTMDEAVAPIEYNYKDKAELERAGLAVHTAGEQPGRSVFLREDSTIYHTYSHYGRGGDHFISTYNHLDLTPLGRQDDPEFAMAWVRHHDDYDYDGGVR